MSSPSTFLAVHEQPGDVALMLMRNEDGALVWTSDVGEATKFATAEAALSAVKEFELRRAQQSVFATWYDYTATRIVEHSHD